MTEVPVDTLASITNYVRNGIPTGGFLRAVLSNDLSGAVGRADNHNLVALVAIVRYIYNHIPAEAWGSPEKVDAWLKLPQVERDMRSRF